MARPSTANRDWFRTTALLVLGGGVSVHVTRMVFGTAWLPPLAPELAFLVLAELLRAFPDWFGLLVNHRAVRLHPRLVGSNQGNGP